MQGRNKEDLRNWNQRIDKFLLSDQFGMEYRRERMWRFVETEVIDRTMSRQIR